MNKVKRAAHRLDSDPISSIRKRLSLGSRSNSLPIQLDEVHVEMNGQTESPRGSDDRLTPPPQPDEANGPGNPNKIVQTSTRDTYEGRRSAAAQSRRSSTKPPGSSHTKEGYTFIGCIKAILYSSKINVLLPFVIVGIISNYVGWSPTVVFVMNFLAIIPLAKVLGYATEDIALRVGETLGGLLNATFGNAVELIVSILALRQNLITVVQASMLGSILSNMLLVLGMCFFAGGMKYKEQEFNQTAAQTSASLLAIAVLSLLIPASFKAATPGFVNETADLLIISRITAIIMLIIYVGYLIFQLKTHAYLFEEASAVDADEREENADEPQLPAFVAVILLVVVTALVGICSEFLVDAIDSVTKSWGITETFVGLILLPIVGNAAEHLTALTVAIKNKVDLAIGVAIGSAMQIALLVTPLMVVIGWIISREMTLFFDVFLTACLLISVLITNYIISDGKSNWLEGLLLMGTYVIIAVAVFYLPDSANSSPGGESNSTTTGT